MTDQSSSDTERTLYLIVAGCPNCGETVHLAEETESPVDLMQDVPISAACCPLCGGLVHEWDVHEDAEIERVPPTQERTQDSGSDRRADR